MCIYCISWQAYFRGKSAADRMDRQDLSGVLSHSKWFLVTEKDIKISGFLFLFYHYCLISLCQVYRTCHTFMISSTEKLPIQISPGHLRQNVAS